MSQHKKIWPLRAASVLLCLVLATTYALSGFYARYAVTASVSDQARTAAYVFHVDEDTFLDLSQIRKPGDSLEVELKLSNSSSGISEVSQEYTLTITELGSLPLTYTLNGATIEKKAEQTGTFAASVGREDTYILFVEWPKTANEPIYASGSGVATVRLNVTAEQID